MKHKSILLTLLLLAMVLPFSAQEALWNQPEVQSPVIHKDNKASFQIYAPQASEVLLSGTWMPREDWAPEPVAMKKDDSGVWTHTTEVLASDLYTYLFLVDGVQVCDPANPYVVRDVASIFNYLVVPGGQGDLYAVQDVPHGTLAYRWYPSPGTGQERRLAIYTPPGYENSTSTYPVLYLLHGMGGDETAWTTLGRTVEILDNLIAQGKARPMIVVMPNGNVSQQAAPGAAPGALRPPSMDLPQTMEGSMETTFPEIIQFVEQNYRANREKSQRAIAGLSMGGFHSLHTSRVHPDTFDYIGLFSPAIMPLEGSVPEIYKNMDAGLTTQNNKGYRLYWIAIGKDDFLYDQVSRYRGTLKRLGLPFTYTETEGGHTWDLWRSYLTLFVPQLFKN